MACGCSSETVSARAWMEGNGASRTYTKLSLTETTKTLPASLSFAELMYPGMWFSEHAGEKAAGTPVRNGLAARCSLRQRRAALTNDDALARLELCREVDLVARRVLGEVDIGQLVAYLDQGGRRSMEEAAGGGRAG